MLGNLMDSAMNNFTSDQLHVAQQSRREKLRVQHCSPSESGNRVDDYSRVLEVVRPVFGPELVQAGDDTRNNDNIMYHSAGGPSEMLGSRNGDMEDQDSIAVNSISMVSPNVDSSLKPRVENNQKHCGVWKSVSVNSNADNWNGTDCIGRYVKNNSPDIGCDISAFEMRAKINTTGRCQSQNLYGDTNYATQFQYQNALSDGVTTALIGLHPNYNVRGGACTSWGSYGVDTEHVRNAPCRYQSDGACLLSGSSWNAEMVNLLNGRTNPVVVDSQSRGGLSLTLCSYPAGSLTTGSQFGNSHIPQSVPLHNVAGIALLDSKPCCPINIARAAGGGHGNFTPESVGPSTNYHRQTGPFGPFTGYATILKSSRFLRPAQQLLDEYCGVIGKFASSSTSDRDIGEFGDLATAVNSIVSDVVTTGDIMGVSIATQQDTDENMKGATNSPRESLRPDYHAKKEKLLFMLEEVSRSYKQYYQQMQMVVSAFEPVAGLAGATPYISSALKTVSRHFNYLKKAISDQLRHIKTFLGEDFSLPHSGIRDKGGYNSKRFKYADHSFQKHESGGSSMGLLEPQQHIWRPQRGLPERAVSVLRAWLFEHFLHPYPTDTDKHMLATQTGLTRSQVSNWFINARVRLWKPMVEEVHMLETKGITERSRNAVEDEDVSTNRVDDHPKILHSLNKMVGSSMASVNLECPETGSLYEMGDVCAAKQYDQEKKSLVESHNVSSIDEGMLNVSRYCQTGHEMDGIGSISLTLGLRQSADELYRLEGSQHPHYLQQQDRMRRHLGGHATHEYAG